MFGELSSMVHSRGPKLISAVEKQTDEGNSEMIRELDMVDDTYSPLDLTQIDQLYQPVEPSDLISK